MAIKPQDENITSAAATASDLRPTVLVFDSGVGGLSVYDEVRQLLPDLHYLYAFDNAGFPMARKAKPLLWNAWWRLLMPLPSVIRSL